MDFCLLLKIWVETLSKNLSGRYSQKRLDQAKKSAAGGLETSLKRVIQKTTEVTGDLIGNKTAHKITKLLKNSQQINSETVTNEHDKEISTENHVCLEERQEIIDELRLK